MPTTAQIVVAMIEDEATVKRFFREGDTVRLQPENPAYEPIVTQRGAGPRQGDRRLQEGLSDGRRHAASERERAAARLGAATAAGGRGCRAGRLDRARSRTSSSAPSATCGSAGRRRLPGLRRALARAVGLRRLRLAAELAPLGGLT